MALSSKKVTFYIGDRDSEEVELHTPHKQFFAHDITISRDIKKLKRLKHDKSYDDFANSFTWFVYKISTFF
jgi:hypothetical protein